MSVQRLATSFGLTSDHVRCTSHEVKSACHPKRVAHVLWFDECKGTNIFSFLQAKKQKKYFSAITTTHNTLAINQLTAKIPENYYSFPQCQKSVICQSVKLSSGGIPRTINTYNKKYILYIFYYRENPRPFFKIPPLPFFLTD